MVKTLRPYQESAIKSLFDYLYTKSGHPLVVAPVGAGKSLLIAEFIRQVHEKYPRTRILMLSHIKELLIQDSEELRLQYPNADYGFYCASLNKKRLHNDITFGSIQSVHNKIANFNRCPEIIIIDESHLVSHNDQTTYRKFIDSVLAINPNAKVIGFTGSPFRSDSGRLDEGNGKLFDGIAYEIGINYMLDNGYLARPVVPKIKTSMDVSGVKTRGGDYISGHLESVVDIDETTKSCVAEMIEQASDRKKWLIFTCGVTHCGHVVDALRLSGISAEMVTGETPDNERDSIINRYKAGEFKALVNVAVLTTGFNVPEIDMLSFMRPTKSPVLYLQTTGRGVRAVYAAGFDLNTKEGRLAAIAASDKPNCLIMDFGGVVASLGPIDEISIKKAGYNPKDVDGIGESLYKICPSCGENCFPAQMYCFKCSHSFINLKKTSEKDMHILSTDRPPETHEVIGVMNRLHNARIDPLNPKIKPPTMCVTYSTMMGPFKEWIGFQHPPGIYPRDKAVKWHLERLPDSPIPNTIEEALLLNYPCPSSVTVRKKDKFWEILSADFSAPKSIVEEKLRLEDFEEIAF